MKYLVLTLLFIQSTLAVEISTTWNADFTKSVEIVCEGNEQCENTFGEGLVFNEEICEECFSTSLNMTFIFNSIGESITAKDQEANMDEFFSFLFMNDFISIKFDTPYDLITSESPIRKKIKYKKLCGFASADPILFFERSVNNEMGYPRYIYCGDSVRELEMFSTDLDSDYLDVLEGSQVF